MTADQVVGRLHEADLDDYAALAAHQLGEAVALLRGYAAQLEGDLPALPPRVRDAVRGMAAGAERTERFVDDLLDLKAAGSVAVERDVVELDAALDRARVRLAGELGRPGTALVAGPLPAVLGSADLLERLFVHLLRAALSARATGPLEIQVAGAASSGVASIEVRDDGVAPAEELLERWFEPFARGRGRGPLVGAGVSLTLSRRIVERHGGTIEVRAHAGAGATVALTLPAAG